jgi:hypothetical protein
MRSLTIFAACSFVAIFMVVPSRGAVEVVALKSLTIQTSGPRAGDAGRKYLNIEGKGNEKYACFGVLIFELPKEIQDKKVKSLTLTLIQSTPRFAKDGAIRFFLSEDLVAEEELKFDPNAPDGLGKQFKSLHPLGSGNFKKIETGKMESCSQTVDDSAQGRIAKGGKLRLVIVPADSAVAATYFGATENDREKNPRLSLELP